MYTQVTYTDLVDGILSRLGQRYGIVFERPSISAMQSYENGKWLYDIHGISVEVFRWERRGNPQPAEYVPGYHWSDDKQVFEARLESDLRAKVEQLMAAQ